MCSHQRCYCSMTSTAAKLSTTVTRKMLRQRWHDTLCTKRNVRTEQATELNSCSVEAWPPALRPRAHYFDRSRHSSPRVKRGRSQSATRPFLAENTSTSAVWACYACRSAVLQLIDRGNTVFSRAVTKLNPYFIKYGGLNVCVCVQRQGDKERERGYCSSRELWRAPHAARRRRTQRAEPVCGTTTLTTPWYPSTNTRFDVHLQFLFKDARTQQAQMIFDSRSTSSPPSLIYDQHCTRTTGSKTPTMAH